MITENTFKKLKTTQKLIFKVNVTSQFILINCTCTIKNDGYIELIFQLHWLYFLPA